MNECPECGKSFHARATQCRCGWKMPAANQRQQCEIDVIENDLVNDIIFLKNSISMQIAKQQIQLAQGLQKCLEKSQKKLAAYRASKAQRLAA